jgi:hypothetical protein
MTYLTAAIIVTSVLYPILSYMSYVTASILHRGILYRLAGLVLKSGMFILICYTSIISDVILFRGAMYDTITIKNGLLLLLVIAALITAKDRKESRDEQVS